MNEYSPLKRVAVRAPLEAFRSQSDIETEWEALRFHSAPQFDQAVHEHETFTEALKATGAEVIALGPHADLTLDSLYVRDALLVTTKGLIACHMGRVTRRGEPYANAAELEQRTGLPLLGEITSPGTLEGGDVIRLNEYTMAVGIGPRTNHAGVDQLQALLGPNIAIHRVPLPAPDHPENVFHLMSMISPIDVDLALVYAPLIPKSFSDWLNRHGIMQLPVPDDEYMTMGCNVLATGPRQALMLSGLPKTRRLLEDHGVQVTTYDGDEISRKGEGGPTCLTLPLRRDPTPFL